MSFDLAFLTTKNVTKNNNWSDMLSLRIFPDSLETPLNFNFDVKKYPD